MKHMKTQGIKTLLERQRQYFKTGATLPVDFRLAQLKKLYTAVKKHENEIHEALPAAATAWPTQTRRCPLENYEWQ